jgi:site-specific recombinase XerD
MQSTIPLTETTSESLEELWSLLDDFRRLLALRLAPATVKQEIIDLERFFTHVHLIGKHYASVTQQDIEGYVLGQSWSQHRRAHTLFSIKRFYEYLKDNRCVETNPAEYIRIVYPRNRGLVQAPALDEIKKVFRRLEQDTSMQGLRLRLMVELAYGSGMRAGEIAGLDFDSINIAERTAHVLGKGSKERVVPLTKRSLDVLEIYGRGTDRQRAPLFVRLKGPDTGQRIASPAVSQLIRKNTGYNAHLFRHACAAHMLINGCNIRCIQEMLGHERIGTTQIYTRLRSEELRQVLNKKHPCARRIFHATKCNFARCTVPTKAEPWE